MQNWLTPERRKVIYDVGVVLGVALLAFGIIDTEMIARAEQGLAMVTALVLGLSNLLARINVEK